MRFLTEDDSLTPLSLSNTQQQIVAKLIAAPEIPGKTGKKLDLDDEKMVASKNALEDLGIITVDPDTEHIELTSKGMDVAREENIADGMGELTSYGEELSTQTDEPDNPPAPQGDMGGLGASAPAISPADTLGSADGTPVRESFKQYLGRVLRRQ